MGRRKPSLPLMNVPYRNPTLREALTILKHVEEQLPRLRQNGKTHFRQVSRLIPLLEHAAQRILRALDKAEQLSQENVEDPALRDTLTNHAAEVYRRVEWALGYLTHLWPRSWDQPTPPQWRRRPGPSAPSAPKRKTPKQRARSEALAQRSEQKARLAAAVKIMRETVEFDLFGHDEAITMAAFDAQNKTSDAEIRKLLDELGYQPPVKVAAPPGPLPSITMF